jgi:hypothetical protein
MLKMDIRSDGRSKPKRLALGRLRQHQVHDVRGGFPHVDGGQLL